MYCVAMRIPLYEPGHELEAYAMAGKAHEEGLTGIEIEPQDYFEYYRLKEFFGQFIAGKL